MTRAGRAGALVAAVALAMTGCASKPDGGAVSETRPPATASPAADPTASAGGSAPTTGTAAPDDGTVPEAFRFAATTVDGKPFDAATLRGRPVVFWFWASWCPRCRAAADDVAGLHRDFADRVQVIGVAGLNSGDDAMRKFVAGQGITGFVNLADDEGQVWRRFGVTSQEYYVLLDAAGTVVHKGALTPQALRERVAALAG
ncbi:redoxin domain-containing protein [Plantactinospora sp. B5E13]|uniref:TlpA family protein disulfide reductase n=1 Tax=unclassified Plantactinospora TaxID=2631981 RepID=UPI00325C73BD